MCVYYYTHSFHVLHGPGHNSTVSLHSRTCLGMESVSTINTLAHAEAIGGYCKPILAAQTAGDHDIMQSR